MTSNSITPTRRITTALQLLLAATSAAISKVNALHQMGYEIRHTTTRRSDNFVLIPRKIGDPEEPPP